jgi:uncharacterized membrane protein YfcA
MDRPLIDFDLALAMEPLTTAGAIVGALIGKVSPDYIVCWLFVAVVGLVSLRTWLKGRDLLAAQAPPQLGGGGGSQPSQGEG